MNTYLVHLVPKSSFSSIPNNQVLFGAICWAIKDLYGKDTLELMLEDFSHHSFVLSNVFPHSLLPKFNIDKDIMSQDNINQLLLEYPNSKGQIFRNMKNYNKIKYFSNGVVTEILENTLDIKTLLVDILLEKNVRYHLKNPYISLKDENLSENLIEQAHEMRNSLNRMSSSTNGDNNQGLLFYANRYFADKDVCFDFYIQTNNLKFFIPIFRYLSDAGIGKDKSVGFNQFDFILGKEIRFVNKTGYKYLISSMIPLKDEINFKESFYDLKATIGRVESRDYFLGEDILKREVVYLTEGSVLKVNQDKLYYGDLPVVKRIDDIKIYQNGLGFLI